MNIRTKCENPVCEATAERTYSDGKGNRLSLCATCYYRLVTGGLSIGTGIGTGPRQGPTNWPYDPHEMFRGKVWR